VKIDMPGVQAFVAIAEQGGFGRAAATLNLTQTALSRRLQALEAFLGVKLVERTTRAVALTRIGENFLPQARRLMTEMSAALMEIRETGRALRGDVTLACVPTVGVQYLPRILQDYCARFPDNRIKVLDHASSGVEQAVLRREAEFGINIAGRHHAELDSTPLFEDRFVMICRDDHALARRKRLSWKQLGPHRVIFPGNDSSNRPLLDQALSEARAEPRSVYEVQRSSTAVGLVAQGIGVAVVPSLAILRGAYPKLRVAALTDPVVTRTFVLLARRSAHLSPAAQALYDMIMKQAAISTMGAGGAA
jgi:DNA-binding transcriptional LysR family regulator